MDEEGVIWYDFLRQLVNFRDLLESGDVETMLLSAFFSWNREAKE